jgi:ubiquinone/menaquinone biosynthesis C-methylase UbiE
MKLARIVGPKGEVIGRDCCDAFLETARADLAESGLSNVRLFRGDAEIALPDGAFDFVFARFGTMFFASPVAGLRKIARRCGRAGAWCISLASPPRRPAMASPR